MMSRLRFATLDGPFYFAYQRPISSMASRMLSKGGECMSFLSFRWFVHVHQLAGGGQDQYPDACRAVTSYDLQ
jgi:hypothetical protein